MSKEKLLTIVINCVKEIGEDLDKEELKSSHKKTKIYGREGLLDSLSLVSLIADLEERICEETGQDIVLADEKAMSQKNSPFKDIETITEYIFHLLHTKS